MKYKVNISEKGKVEIFVEVSKEQFNKAYNLAVSELGKNVTVPGFRPGHAPQELIEQQIGESRILNQTASDLVSKQLAEIFEKEKLSALNTPGIAIQKLSRGLEFIFTATFTQKPKVKIGDWKKIKVKKIKQKEVLDSDVEASINNIFEAWSKQQETKAGTSDLAGEKVADNNGEAEDKRKYIYDAKGNKIFLGKSTQSPAAPADLKINDDFAQKLGAKDLEDLKRIVRSDLDTIMANNVEAKFENEIFDELIKLADVDAPDILIDDELNRMIIRLEGQLEKQGQKLEDYLKQQNTTFDALKAKWRPDAEKIAKINLIVEEIGKSEGVKVDDAEIESAKKTVDNANLDESQKTQLDLYLRSSIFQAKTLDLIKKTVEAIQP